MDVRNCLNIRTFLGIITCENLIVKFLIFKFGCFPKVLHECLKENEKSGRPLITTERGEHGDG